MGIDPGTNIMGYGVVGVKGNKFTAISLGVIQLDKLDDPYLKLKMIFERVCGLIESFKPDEMALEAPFYGKNVQSMLKLGRAQGVAMAAALSKQVPVCEYQPRKVKQSVTGNGNASKEQVAHLVQKILNIKDMPTYFDATDGIAVALCHCFQISGPIKSGGAKSGSWKAFLSSNPGKVIKP